MSDTNNKTRLIAIAVAVIIIAALAVLLIPHTFTKNSSLTYSNTAAGVSITFPESWKGKFITSPVDELDEETFVEVFHKANYEKYREQNLEFGWLFSILKVENARFDELWAAYRETGGANPVARDDKYIYLMLSPTDVQSDADKTLHDEYRQLAGSIDEVIRAFITENGLRTYDFNAYKEKYILPFVNSGTAFANWNRAEENEAIRFLEIYKYMSSEDTKTDPLQFARDNGVDYAVPRDIVESIVTEYFDVSPEYLRSMFRYNGELQCYVDQFNSSGPDPIPDILSYTENEQSIVIKFANRWSDESFEGGVYEVGIKKSPDGFKYAYSKVLSGADYTRPDKKIEKTTLAGNDKEKTVSSIADEYLSDDEMTVAGVKLGMSYEEVMDILGGYDEAFDNTPTVKSIFKEGCHFGLYQMDESFQNQSDLSKTDGVYRLLNVSANTASPYEFPRGIKIGDSIEDVLAKFPGKDKELRKWAYQNIYGKDETGYPRAFLEFTMFDESYRFVATTTRQTLEVQFNRENCVSAIQVCKEDS